MEKRNRWMLVLLIVLTVLFTLLIAWAVGIPMLRLISQPEEFQAWVEARGVWGRVAFMGMVIFQTIIAFVPGEPFEIAAGYAFGAVEGTLLCLAASFLGSVAVFLLVRRLGMRLVRMFFSEEKLRSLRFLKTPPKRELVYLMLFMLPGTPKDLLCYFAGLTDLRLPVWLLMCSLGRLPSIVTSTAGGHALGHRDYLGAVIIFAVTFLVSGLGICLYHWIQKRHEE